MVHKILALASVAPALAHNWVNTPSRASGASTVRPCLPRLNQNVPHAQVGPGDEFEIEWMTGHAGGTMFHFTIVSANYTDNLMNITRNLLTEYLEEADYIISTTGQSGPNVYNYLHRTSPIPARMQKYHRTRDDVAVNADDYLGQVPVGDPRYIERAARFQGHGNMPSDQNGGLLWAYKDPQLNDDWRASYNNVRFPWIESVHRFRCAYHHPSRFDVARFTVPGRDGYGKYIVHYWWGGYKDCIDVDYVDFPVQNVYGIKGNGTSYQKVDHCYFPDPRRIWSSCLEVVTTPLECMRECDRRGVTSCNGINVVPLKTDPHVYFQNVNLIPWSNDTCRQSIDDFDGAPDDTLVCFAVQARDRTDVLHSYEVTDDPEDPMFFSTCYLREPNYIFEGVAPPPVDPRTPWIFADQCISCQDAVKNYNKDFPMSPRWSIATKCENCDDLLIAKPVQKPEWELMFEARECDGAYNNWAVESWTGPVYRHNTCPEEEWEVINTNGDRRPVCTKRLSPRGTSSATEQDCQELALRDRECGDIAYMYRSECYCYKKKECCSVCSPKANTRSSRTNQTKIYRLGQYTEPADPTCARGVLNEDSTFCCPSTCAICGNTYEIPKAGQTIGDIKDNCFHQQGMCCTDGHTRDCSTHSAPCRM